MTGAGPLMGVFATSGGGVSTGAGMGTRRAGRDPGTRGKAWPIVPWRGRRGHSATRERDQLRRGAAGQHLVQRVRFTLVEW